MFQLECLARMMILQTRVLHIGVSRPCSNFNPWACNGWSHQGGMRQSETRSLETHGGGFSRWLGSL